MFFNLLSQAAERDEDAAWDRGVSFLKEGRLHQYLCLYRESKQEDTRFVFLEEVMEKEWIFIVVAVGISFYWVFCRAKEQGGGRKKVVFSFKFF